MGAYNIGRATETCLCCAWPDRFEIAVDLAAPLHQIEVHLQPEKESFRQAKIAGKPQIGIAVTSRLPSTISLMRRGAT